MTDSRVNTGARCLSVMCFENEVFIRFLSVKWYVFLGFYTLTVPFLFLHSTATEDWFWDATDGGSKGSLGDKES